MNRLNKILAAATAASLMTLAWPAMAETSAADIARLGKDLTPTGAEKAGNSAGTIPAWDGGLCSPPSGWDKNKGYTDPFPGDKPKFVITAANASQYAANLTEGAMALLKKYDNFKMPVYQTRRTQCYPQSVYDTIKAEAPNIKLNGFGVSGREASTTPFPVPKEPLEVYWNHILRYLGGGIVREYASLPVRANGDYFTITAVEKRIFMQNMDEKTPNRLVNYINYFTGPATLEGTVFLVHEPVDQVKEQRAAWIYNAGQRRVRRAPDLSYDNINDGTEGLRTTDQYDAYNGAPDRYDWKLVGKKEIYVPYNVYKMGDKSVSYKTLATPGTPNSDYMRYELHRVWVLDATLKKGSKHVYGRRTLYIDEDSWSVLWEDAYDTRGGLWRVGVHPVIQFYDAQVMWYQASIWHDLNNGAYLMSYISNEIKTPWEFNEKGRLADYQPSALRRAGTK